MSTSFETSLVSHLSDLALAAGAKIMEIYGTDFEVLDKADSSPVTKADQLAEAVILAGLSALAPDIPVVAEEEVAAGRVPQTKERFFLVDPLDGTREFISRNGEFTVNIALVVHGVPVAGVVYAPALGQLFGGAAGLGAFKAEVVEGIAGAPQPIHVRPAPEEGVCAIGSRSHGSAETEAWLARFKLASFVGAGSSLKFCLVAEGRADLYPRFGRTMEWDTAAGDAVLRAAGGLVTRVDGTPLTYGKGLEAGGDPYGNPHFVAYGDTALAAAAKA